VAKGIKTYLNFELKDHYIKVDNAARKKHNELTMKLIEQKTNDGLVKFKDDYENESLSQLVKNANDISGERCLEKDGRLIQQTDPVFQDPTESNLGRAHFFAPRKKLFGMYYNTFWFNICVIWLMSVVLIVTLYYDVFKFVLVSFGRVGKRFTKKKS
jgi:hypothetical protein